MLFSEGNCFYMVFSEGNCFYMVFSEGNFFTLAAHVTDVFTVISINFYANSHCMMKFRVCDVVIW